MLSPFIRVNGSTCSLSEWRNGTHEGMLLGWVEIWCPDQRQESAFRDKLRRLYCDREDAACPPGDDGQYAGQRKIFILYFAHYNVLAERKLVWFVSCTYAERRYCFDEGMLERREECNTGIVPVCGCSGSKCEKQGKENPRRVTFMSSCCWKPIQSFVYYIEFSQCYHSVIRCLNCDAIDSFSSFL